MTAASRAAGGYRHPPPATVLVQQGPAQRGLLQRGPARRGLVRRGRGAAGGQVDLATGYELCRRLNAAHGRTFYLATRFLPPQRRHHVHALYGFARYADDLVDHMDLSWTPGQRRAALEGWSRSFLQALDGGTTGDPVLQAVIATVRELHIERRDLEAFLASMAMDLTVSRYPTYGDLRRYVHGSAAVIGAMMLPVLGASGPRARARAMDLGVAFQLTNFLRDVAEDWDRGRIYLPQEDLDAFGVSERDFHARRVGPSFRRLLAFEAARTRAIYRRAEEGWALLPPASRRCIRIAHRLYAGILDALERADYQVFRTRASVPARRKAMIVLPELARRGP